MLISDADLLDCRQSAISDTWMRQLRTSANVAGRLQGHGDVREQFISLARTQRLNRFCGPGWLAVGDAAMAFDPLSSHGITKGLRHGWMAGLTIADHLAGNEAALPGFCADLEQIFAEYLVTRQAYYQLEQRWPHARFWQRRHAAPRVRGDAVLA